MATRITSCHVNSGEAPPSCLIKMDQAGELIAAAEEVGLMPETSLPNRWPHNVASERDIREEKGCCRAIHLRSGLPYHMHTPSFPFACLSLSFNCMAPVGDKTQWKALTKEPFNGTRACFGQLVWYRKKGSKKTLDLNMAPGLFLGWRIDPGIRYRNVVRVMDYADFGEKRNVNAVDVPEPELFTEEGPPVFPVANAAHKSLVDGSTLESAARRALPDYPLREVPFPPDSGKAPPPTSRDVKSRAVYITVERIIKFGETLGCKACLGNGSKHTDACHERFANLLKEQREELAAPGCPGGMRCLGNLAACESACCSLCWSECCALLGTACQTRAAFWRSCTLSQGSTLTLTTALRKRAANIYRNSYRASGSGHVRSGVRG